MSDPNWNRGFYYDGIPPHSGMKLARRACHLVSIWETDLSEIATITYRSGPEWEERFGRRMLSDTEAGDKQGIPNLSPDFLIETYLDHQVSYPSLGFPSLHLLGRALLLNLRCQFDDLPLESNGSL